jgi:hypothetical protein
MVDRLKDPIIPLHVLFLHALCLPGCGAGCRKFCGAAEKEACGAAGWAVGRCAAGGAMPREKNLTMLLMPAFMPPRRLGKAGGRPACSVLPTLVMDFRPACSQNLDVEKKKMGPKRKRPFFDSIVQNGVIPNKIVKICKFFCRQNAFK